MNLLILVILPILSALAVLPFKQRQQVRFIALAGSLLQWVAALALFYFYTINGNKDAVMVFEQNYQWYEPLNINFHIGVDGISIAMILLTATVVLAGILVSWKEERMSK
jgi:NADH-quinone oxidoreductase subunit M